MVYILLENGFEEAEAIVPAGILRRADVPVTIVGVPGKYVESARGIKICADSVFDETEFSDMEMLMLPGGQPGVDNLWANEKVKDLVRKTAEAGIHLAAICAAPIIPGRLGLLNGKKAVCYPGLEGELQGAEIVNLSAVTDGKFTTGRSAGSSFTFGYEALSVLRGGDIVSELKKKSFYESQG